jgi:hypothetical protein
VVARAAAAEVIAWAFVLEIVQPTIELNALGG